MNSGYEFLLYEVRGHTCWLTLNRPEQRNALHPGLFTELQVAFAAADANDDIRVIVLTGSGKEAFCAGGDLKSFAALKELKSSREFTVNIFRMFRAVEQVSKPTIAAVHGWAVAGGTELTLACDIVVADHTAKFGLFEASVGLYPGFGVVRGLDHIRMHPVRYVSLTANSLNAAEAFAMGLITRLVPDGQLETEATRIADRIAQGAPLAITTAKAVINRNLEQSGIYQHTISGVTLLQTTEDKHEAVRAFVEKRKPRFCSR
jgi:enoyl-CoA hydratase